MKILSRTEQHGRVVELTETEFREFTKLANSIEGKTESEVIWNFQLHDHGMISEEVNLDGVFGAIEAYYSAKFRINELKKLVASFEFTIGKRE